MKGVLFAIGIILLISLAGFISYTAVHSYENPGNSDFFPFWLSGRFIAQGLNPYSAADWLQGREFFHSAFPPDPTFVYPLPLAVFLTPLGLLDLKTAFFIWVFSSVISLYFCIGCFINYFGKEKIHFILPIIAGVIIFRPLVSLLLNGQISAFILVTILLSIRLINKNHLFLGGAVLTLIMLKPQLGGLLLFLSGCYFLRHKNYRILAGMAFFGVILYLLGWIVSTDWVPQYLSILGSKFNDYYGYTPTIWGLVFYLTGFRYTLATSLGITFSVIIILAVLSFIWKDRSISPAVAIGMAIPIGLMITPYLWPYDQVLLLLPIVQLMVFLQKSNAKYLPISIAFIGISILSYVLYGITINIQMENLNALLTLIVLIGFISAFILSHKSRLDDVEVTIDSD